MARACLEHAFITLKNHKSYGGDETVIVDNGADDTDNTSDDETCRVLTITGTGNTDRVIQTRANVRGTTKYAEAKVTEINPDFTVAYRKTKASLDSTINQDNPWHLDSSNLTLWLKASSVLQNDNSMISQWVGNSEQTLTLDQSTNADKPTFQTRAINGRPAVEFDGDDFLSRDNTTLSTLVQSDTASVFVVLNQDGSSAKNTIFDLQAPDKSNRFSTSLTWTDDLYFDFGDTTNGDGRIQDAQPNEWDDSDHLVELFRNESDEIRVDNSSLSSGSFSDTLDSAEMDTTYTLWLGSESGDSNHFKGQIAELIIFKDALSDTEKGQVRNYLNQKYNLY